MPSVTYRSTRGGQTGVDFRTVVMQGLARDRGLFVPETFPTITEQELKEWRGLSYPDLAVQVIRKYVDDDQVPFHVLNDIVHRSCKAFRHPDVTPVVNVGGHAILELFHGPTFAFKDVALQMLGNFFEYFLETGSNEGRLTVLGATSGDTGSAAMAGLRGKRGVYCFILYPDGRVSKIQELQMMTVTDSNIYSCAVSNANFDDCQDIVKASFDTPKFRDAVHLGAVNSINWCRVLAQTTYYFWSYFRVTDNGSTHETVVNYSVPTGNFGDVLAGYYAKLMGLPVGRLVVATNENDILHRFFENGEYHRESIQETLSPSMDICVSSNFERYLYHLADNNAVTLAGWMNEFESTSKLTLKDALLQRARDDFGSSRVDTNETLQTIKEYYQKHGYILCPHSAVGVKAIVKLGIVNQNTVCLATAHAAKFSDAVEQAVSPLPQPPSALEALKSAPKKKYKVPKDVAYIHKFITDEVMGKKRAARTDTLQSVGMGVLATGIIAVAINYLLQRKRQ